MSYWNHKVTIGNYSFPRFMSGPLDGVTDSPFRTLVRQFSPDELLYSEMRHVACVANDIGGKKALAFEQGERPLNFQMTTNGTDFIQEACHKVLQAGVDLVDLNIGCPAKNVVGSGSGSALMADLVLLKKVLLLFKQELADVPFTVKMRAGFKEINAIDVAMLAQDCGVAALAIHPRSQTQKFDGTPNYALAAEVKKAVSIPVLFSGGVVDFASAQFVYKQTGVDGFLIGRGMWGKPWKLKELHEHAHGREFVVDNKLRLSCALQQLDNMLAYYGDNGLYCFRKHLPFYIKGVEGASKVRSHLVTCESVDMVKKELRRILG